MTVEECLNSLQAILDASEGRSLTVDEADRYEALERDLEAARRTEQIHARNRAYNMPVTDVVIPARTGRTDEDRAFENYLRTGQPNADLTRATNAQSEGGSTSGGYLVPAGFRQKLVEVRKAFGGFAAEAESLSTDTGNPLEYPTNDDTANTGDITAESAAVASGADLGFGTVTLGAYKYTSAGAGSNLPLRVSVELLQDSAFDVEALVARKLGERIARKQAQHWVTGTGVGQPKGIVASSLTSDQDLVTPDTPAYVDLETFQDLLDDAYDPNAKWLMRKSTWGLLRRIVDTTGRPLIQSSIEGIAGRPARLLLGKEVIIDEAMPVLSSAADTYAIAYGDFREAYVIRRVSNLAVVVNPYTRAANGEVEFTAWERADGNIQNRSAYKILQNNT